MSDLNDPRHPRSPFNRFNYDSPWSIVNPTNPHYNPRAAADELSWYVGAGIILAVVGFPLILISRLVRALSGSIEQWFWPVFCIGMVTLQFFFIGCLVSVVSVKGLGFLMNGRLIGSTLMMGTADFLYYFLYYLPGVRGKT